MVPSPIAKVRTELHAAIYVEFRVTGAGSGDLRLADYGRSRAGLELLRHPCGFVVAGPLRADPPQRTEGAPAMSFVVA